MAEPVAVLAGGDSGAVGEFLLFDGSGSYDPDGTIFRWRCSFGDGGKAQGKGHPGTFGHAYQAEGSYKLQFVVTDNRKQRSATLTRIITIGAEETDPDPDTVPDAFTFAAQTGVARSTVITSDTVTISGLTAASPITVVGGTYSINGGSFVSTAGTITNGQTVAVRLTSAAVYAAVSEVLLTIGGVLGTFAVTTEAEAIDTTPEPFAFQAQVGAATATVIESNTVTIQGINTPVPITISGASGEYSIDGAAYTTSAGTISNGQRLRVKLTSSGSNSTAVTATVTVGTATATFTVTTVAAPADDGTPDPFGWPSITGQPIATVVTSSSITVSGINTTVDISVAGGGSPQYSINGGAFTSSPGSGTVSNGNTIRVRLTSSGTQGVTLTASVTIGGVVGSFSVTTAVISVSGTTYYVAKAAEGGSDSNNGTSVGTPFLTVAKGISALRSEDRLLIRVGTYLERITGVPSGVSDSRRTRIANYNSEAVTLKAPVSSTLGVIWLDGNYTWIEFDGIHTDGTNQVNPGFVIWFSTNNRNNVHHIRYKNATVTSPDTGGGGAIMLGSHQLMGQTGANHIQNVTVTGGGFASCSAQPFECSSYAVYVEGPDNLIENCDFSQVSGFGIQIYNAGGDSPNNTIVRNNRIHNITRSGYADVLGILVYGGNNNQIYNNLIYDLNFVAGPSSVGYGVVVAGPATNTKIWHNTIANNTTVGGIHIESGVTGTETRNNIAYNNNGRPAYVNDGGSTNVQSHNLFGTNPLFVSLAGNNFALTASSPARNAGLTIPGVTSDFAGLSRPQGSGVDIGAYEYDE